MNSTAIAKTNDSVAILYLHTNITKQLELVMMNWYWWTGELVFHKGDEVLINIQSHKPHNINYENSLINVYKLIIHFLICPIRTSSEAKPTHYFIKILDQACAGQSRRLVKQGTN